MCEVLCQKVCTGAAGTTIGKRYARTDELGIPFAITVDRDCIDAGSLQGTVTVRERDSTSQVRPFEVFGCVKLLIALASDTVG